MSPLVVCDHGAKNMQIICPVAGCFSTTVLLTDFVGREECKIKGKSGKKEQRNENGVS